MALQTEVRPRSRAPVLPGSGSELGAGVRAGAAAAARLQRRRKIPVVLPVGEVVLIQMEAEGGCLCRGVVI